jgi:hypothetical protein
MLSYALFLYLELNSYLPFVTICGAKARSGMTPAQRSAALGLYPPPRRVF